MSNAPPPPADRLRSLDALRGFDMFWIIGGDDLGQALGTWYYGRPHNWLTEQLEHVEWEGFRFYDLIFPLFLFLVGAVIPFSLASLRRRGAAPVTVYGRIARRVLLLFALGRPGDPETLPEDEREVPNQRRPIHQTICEGPFAAGPLAP